MTGWRSSPRTVSSSVLYANSADVRWHLAPKPAAGQRGVWLHETEGRLRDLAPFEPRHERRGEGRNVNWQTRTLLDVDGVTPVAPSVDPVFFRYSGFPLTAVTALLLRHHPSSSPITPPR